MIHAEIDKVVASKHAKEQVLVGALQGGAMAVRAVYFVQGEARGLRVLLGLGGAGGQARAGPDWRHQGDAGEVVHGTIDEGNGAGRRWRNSSRRRARRCRTMTTRWYWPDAPGADEAAAEFVEGLLGLGED